MRNIFILLFCTLLSANAMATAHSMQAHIFLQQASLPNNSELFSTLKSEWQINAQNVTVTSSSISFDIAGGHVDYTLVAQRLPDADWTAFAHIAWLWKSAKAEMMGHKAYLKLSFTGNETQTAYQSELALARINASLFHVMGSNVIGILNTDRYLMLDRNLYRETMKNLPADEAPAYLMVYFGMYDEASKRSGYTYGLYQFNMPEVEIVNSARSLHEVHAVLVQTVSNLLTKGSPQDNKDTKAAVKVSVSEGVFVNGQTMKIGFE